MTMCGNQGWRKVGREKVVNRRAPAFKNYLKLQLAASEKLTQRTARSPTAAITRSDARIFGILRRF